MKNIKVLFIGCGNMWEAILKSFLDFWFNPKNIFISERRDEKKKYLKEKYNVETEILPKDFQIIILAIKPQQISDLKIKIPENCLVISILAWTKIETIQEKLWAKKVARIMPNLPLMFGKWMSTFYWQNLNKEEKDMIIWIFSQSWKIFELESEEKMHQSTLLAGSWPWFYFHFVSSFEKLAINYWFSQKEAEMLAKETIIWSAEVLKNSEDSAKIWQERVTSKWWTTEATIQEFWKLWLENIFEKALKKWIERSEELGNK